MGRFRAAGVWKSPILTILTNHDELIYTLTIVTKTLTKAAAKKRRARKKARERRRQMEQDVLIAKTRGWIAILMDRRKVSRAELARRIGKSKPYVTQVLRAPRNITLRTLADLAWALDANVRLSLVKRIGKRPRFRRR